MVIYHCKHSSNRSVNQWNLSTCGQIDRNRRLWYISSEYSVMSRRRCGRVSRCRKHLSSLEESPPLPFTIPHSECSILIERFDD
jgi:hypothetical protein